MHSPFVFEFINNVLEDKRNFYAFSSVESLRNLLKQDPKVLKVNDLGAGSSMNKGRNRSIGSIASTSLSPPFVCKILFKIVNHFKPEKMLELGTSLGISALYQHFAALNSKLITLEGAEEIADQAEKNFQRLEVDSIELIRGNFDETLPIALKKLSKLDYVFLDGNHRKNATISYFEQCLEFADEKSVFVLDDIYWSKEMTEAWEQIKSHPKVTLSIDLFFLGLVFFRKENIKKEHFKLIKSNWKSWEMGFFK